MSNQKQQAKAVDAHHAKNTARAARYTAKCNACGIATSRATCDQFNGFNVLNCRGCGRTKYAYAVMGTVSEAHKCGAKCLEGTGLKCECSCGGANHGASHEVAA